MTRPDRTLRTAADLVAAGLIAPADAAAAAQVGERYAVAVTPAMTALMPRGPAVDRAAADPIARQFLPDLNELDVRPEERADPIGDEAHSPLPGIVHRYPDRVLLKIVHVCPVYCRFCFRREMVGPGGKGALDEAELSAAIAYVAARPEIFEVILTGGDPFVLSARRVRDVTRALAAIPHVKVIRWHTRVPVVAPERVTADFARALRASGKAVYVAVHANHSSEFTPAAETALARLADAGIALVRSTTTPTPSPR